MGVCVFWTMQALQCIVTAVHNRGPVSIALHVTSKFKAYKKGVFDDTSCPRKCPNHALLVTG